MDCPPECDPGEKEYPSSDDRSAILHGYQVVGFRMLNPTYERMIANFTTDYRMTLAEIELNSKMV